jgi:hypothetical protein
LKKFFFAFRSRFSSLLFPILLSCFAFYVSSIYVQVARPRRNKKDEAEHDHFRIRRCSQSLGQRENAASEGEEEKSSESSRLGEMHLRGETASGASCGEYLQRVSSEMLRRTVKLMV